MTSTSATLEELVEQFAKLPGIGRKTAFRLAYHVLKASPESARNLARAILDVKEKIRTCSICFNISDDDPCPICGDAGRNQQPLCVVEEPHDVLAFQRAAAFDGVFRLLGIVSPIDALSGNVWTKLVEHTGLAAASTRPTNHPDLLPRHRPAAQATKT